MDNQELSIAQVRLFQSRVINTRSEFLIEDNLLFHALEVFMSTIKKEFENTSPSTDAIGTLITEFGRCKDMITVKGPIKSNSDRQHYLKMIREVRSEVISVCRLMENYINAGKLRYVDIKE